MKQVPYKKNTFEAIKKTCIDTGARFADGADRVAEICIEENTERKLNRVKDETIGMVKDIIRSAKKNTKSITVSEGLCDVSYGMGKVFRWLRDLYGDFDKVG